MSLSKNIGKCRKCGFPMYQCKCHFNTIAEPMSKEQTPIEELELRLNVMSSQEFIDWIRIEGLSKLKSSQDTKVLEALEREVPKAYDAGWKCCLMGDKFEGWDIEHTMETRKKKYYETTVKPKYE